MDQNERPLYEEATPFRDEISQNGRGFGVASLVLGIFGILCCCFWPLGGTCAILALVFALIGRKSRGFFDGLSLAGLVLAIIGLVLFGYLVIDEILLALDPARAEEQAKLLEEYMKMLEELYGSPSTALHIWH